MRFQWSGLQFSKQLFLIVWWILLLSQCWKSLLKSWDTLITSIHPGVAIIKHKYFLWWPRKEKNTICLAREIKFWRRTRLWIKRLPFYCFPRFVFNCFFVMRFVKVRGNELSHSWRNFVKRCMLTKTLKQVFKRKFMFFWVMVHLKSSIATIKNVICKKLYLRKTR